MKILNRVLGKLSAVYKTDSPIQAPGNIDLQGALQLVHSVSAMADREAARQAVLAGSAGGTTRDGWFMLGIENTHGAANTQNNTYSILQANMAVDGVFLNLDLYDLELFAVDCHYSGVNDLTQSAGFVAPTSPAGGGVSLGSGYRIPVFQSTTKCNTTTPIHLRNELAAQLPLRIGRDWTLRFISTSDGVMSNVFMWFFFRIWPR